MQEISAVKREQARRATEHKILDDELQTWRERAKNTRETNKVNAISEAEAIALERKLTEDYERKMLLERMNGEKEKWIAAINTTFSQIEGSVLLLLTTVTNLISHSLLFCLEVDSYSFKSHNTILANHAVF